MKKGCAVFLLMSCLLIKSLFADRSHQLAPFLGSQDERPQLNAAYGAIDDPGLEAGQGTQPRPEHWENSARCKAKCALAGAMGFIALWVWFAIECKKECLSRGVSPESLEA